jgi:hypothetical protein
MGNPPTAFEDVLAECIEALEQGTATLESCLAKHPAHAADLQALLPAMLMLQRAPGVQPTPAFRQQARRRLLQTIEPATQVPFWESLRQKLASYHPLFNERRTRMAWIVSLAVIASLLFGGGTVLAADNALPGQLLYPLDRSLENLQLRLNPDPAAQAELYLGFAAERLEEAAAVASAEAGGRLDIALNGYGESVAAIARLVGSAEGGDQEALSTLLETALPDHDARLASLTTQNQGEVRNTAPDGDGGEQAPNDFCASGETHPVAASLAEQYEVDPAVIMAWFCPDEGEEDNGFGFGQIMLALQTAEGDIDLAETFLAARAAGDGWGRIWQELDLIGPSHDVPAGPPDHAGQPDGAQVGPPDDVPAGPPDHAGQPADAPVGPPDHAGQPDDVPAGPPDDVPAGPPDHAGKPDDVPVGPPDHAGPPADVPVGPPTTP